MENQYSRTELLVGKDGIEKIKNAKVAVFGLGGVGSYVVEALARVGIGHLVLVDYDKYDVTNINRQLGAYHSTIGIYKVEVMKERIKDINPEAVVEIYRPTVSASTYNYSEEYKIENSLEYAGGQSTNTEVLQINNQGGLIGFSITSGNLGEYIFSENEKLPSDGRLLAKAGIKSEEINFNISFDLIIETESNHRFKANIKLDLPTGNILEEGVGSLEDTQLENIVFKRF